ncbi:MAG: hypothetical protein MMC23_004473 [Stictis urceolatum]|nr:hypothetical protein [Stictis urceolata]
MSAHPAPGTLSLPTLLSSMSPTLHPSTFVWAALAPGNQLLTQAPLQMTFLEAEGQTVILTQEAADESRLSYTFPSRMITLNVHSSLEAVGFMAAVANRLKGLGIGVNPVSGYYHDHLFVPAGEEERVLGELKAMAEEAKAE